MLANMLTKSDLGNNFPIFSYLSRCWYFPAKFHKPSGSFYIPREGRRRPIFRAVLLLFVVHSAVLSTRTFVAGAVTRDCPLEFLAFGIACSVTFSGLTCMGVIVDQTIEIQIKLWNELLTRLNQAGPRRRDQKRSWQELWICYVPLILHSANLTWPVVYSIKPDLPYSLYGNVPNMFKCTPVLFLCCLGDFVLTSFYLSIANYFVVFIMLFIMLMRSELTALKEKLCRFGIHQDTGAERSTQDDDNEMGSQDKAGVMVTMKNELENQPKMKVVCKGKGGENVEKVGVEASQEGTVKVESGARGKVERKGKGKLLTVSGKVEPEKTPAGGTVEKWDTKTKKWELKRNEKLGVAIKGEQAVKSKKNRTRKNKKENVKRVEKVSDAEELKNLCTALEYMKLLFHLFNLGFRYANFFLKNMAITNTIWCVFACIRLAKSHPDFAFFYGVISVVDIMNFLGLFNDAFHLTGQAEECKALILIQATVLLKKNLLSKDEWNELRCRIVAIPLLAVYSGHFHRLERLSTLNFINYILNQLANLLLAF